MAEIVEKFTRDNGYMFVSYIDLTQIEHRDDIKDEYVCKLIEPSHNFGVYIRAGYWYDQDPDGSSGWDGVYWYLYFFLIDNDGPEEFSSPDIVEHKDLCGKTSDELYEFCKERLEWHMDNMR